MKIGVIGREYRRKAYLPTYAKNKEHLIFILQQEIKKQKKEFKKSTGSNIYMKRSMSF